MTATLQIWDPHFHIFDVTENTQSGHDRKVLSLPPGRLVYLPSDYEKDIAAAGPGFELTGGTWLEAVSVCHNHKTGSELAADCLAEARWAARELHRSEKKYVRVPSAPLEDPDIATLLSELAGDTGVRGVRQILNFKPSWPRNDKLGELLDNQQWQKGFAMLQNYGFSFDMQLNPHQFKKAAAFIRKFPTVPVIINHLGSPTLADLTEREKAAQYWQGMQSLAGRENTYIKVSMLQYTHKEWDQIGAVTDAIYRVIEVFGIERCFFASNFPVDLNAGWSADRLYGVFRKLAAARYTLAGQRSLFAENAKRAYRV